MPISPESLVGLSLEWTGVHHSETGDFEDLSTHTVTYESSDVAYVTASGKLVGEATYEYQRLDDEVAVVLYRPNEYQGRSNVVLHAIFDFSRGTDRAVLEQDGRPFAVADGTFREVETPPRPSDAATGDE